MKERKPEDKAEALSSGLRSYVLSLAGLYNLVDSIEESRVFAIVHMTSFPAGVSAESADVPMAVKAVTYHTILTNSGLPKSAILVFQRRPLLADVLQIEIHGFVLSPK